MKRLLLGLLVIVHALAHANFVVFAATSGPTWIIEPLWSIAILGYLAAGLGMLRVPLVRDRWKQLLVAGTVGSILLLLTTRALLGAAGVVLDIMLLVLVLEWGQVRVDQDVKFAEVVGAEGLGHPLLHRAAWGFGFAFLLYAVVVVAARPVTMRWGTSAAERAAQLPGDDVLPVGARYRIDHGITIHAPADSVWPWLAQLGQDRGGFYSYSWLERMIGDQITNADRVHPEWQSVQTGQLVRATQPDYLGGRFGDVGWRVQRVEPGRALVLENWGSFVVQPVDANTSRFLVRTRGDGMPTLKGIVLGPLSVFVFEPAHFIMERGMMRGVRARAERMVQPSRLSLR